MKPHSISCKKPLLLWDFPPADLSHVPPLYTVVLLTMSTTVGVQQVTRALCNQFLQSISLCPSFCPQFSSAAQLCPTLCDPVLSLLAGTHIFPLILQGAKTVI